MKKTEEFVEEVKNKMDHDAPNIWMHLIDQKEKGFDYVVYPDQDMVRQDDFSSFITKEDAKEYLNAEKSEDNPMVAHPISKLMDALVPLVEQELNDFFDRSPGKEHGKNSEHEMEM
jgi:non-homologous end joining protein Ku